MSSDDLSNMDFSGALMALRSNEENGVDALDVLGLDHYRATEFALKIAEAVVGEPSEGMKTVYWKCSGESGAMKARVLERAARRFKAMRDQMLREIK